MRGWSILELATVGKYHYPWDWRDKEKEEFTELERAIAVAVAEGKGHKIGAAPLVEIHWPCQTVLWKGGGMGDKYSNHFLLSSPPLSPIRASSMDQSQQKPEGKEAHLIQSTVRWYPGEQSWREKGVNYTQRGKRRCSRILLITAWRKSSRDTRSKSSTPRTIGTYHRISGISWWWLEMEWPTVMEMKDKEKT